MNKIIDFSKPVTVTIKECAEAKEILKRVGFNMVDNAFLQATVGRVVSINKGAKIKKIAVSTIAQAFVDEGFEVINEEE